MAPTVGRAAGGPVNPGAVYVVGDPGPERFAMAEMTVTVRCRVRGLWVARVLGRLPDPVGRWARCRIRVDGAVGRGPWEEIARWEEPA